MVGVRKNENLFSVQKKEAAGRFRLGLRFQKVRFKNSDFKMCDLKKWFLKTQLSVWQNRSLIFKIAG